MKSYFIFYLTLAIVGFIIVAIIFFGPIMLTAKGFVLFFAKSYTWGIIDLILGFFLLWLIKPISILTNKDLKII